MTNIKFKEIDLPKGLEEKVLSRVEKTAAKEILKRKILGGFALSSSLFAFFEFSLYLISETKKSGLLDYTSLFLSDYKIVMSNFSSYILSVVDSVPFFAITLSVISILAIMASVRYLFGINKFGYESEGLLA